VANLADEETKALKAWMVAEATADVSLTMSISIVRFANSLVLLTILSQFNSFAFGSVDRLLW
jgi:hypothetical protein